MDKKGYIEELEFCLNLWEKQAGCKFGGSTKCGECAAPYILWKFITREILHRDMERLTLDDWKIKLNHIKT
ncbi:MAG: hypothetical protein ACP5D2_04625 [Candidatus Nanoarchaeia archaeon]